MRKFKVSASNVNVRYKKPALSHKQKLLLKKVLMDNDKSLKPHYEQWVPSILSLHDIGKLSDKDFYEWVNFHFVKLTSESDGFYVRNFSHTLLKFLVENSDNEIIQMFIATGTTSKKILRILAESKFDIVKENVAYNVYTSPDILVNLYSENNDQTKSSVAINPSTPVWLLEKIAVEETSNELLSLIASNTSTPVSYLISLSNRKDINNQVIWGLATNTKTPTKILDRLYEQDVTKLRLKDFIVHPSASEELLNKILFSLNFNKTLEVHTASYFFTNLSINTDFLRKVLLKFNLRENKNRLQWVFIERACARFKTLPEYASLPDEWVQEILFPNIKLDN